MWRTGWQWGMGASYLAPPPPRLRGGSFEKQPLWFLNQLIVWEASWNLCFFKSKFCCFFPIPSLWSCHQYTSNITISQSSTNNPSFCTFSKSVALHTPINSGWLKLKVSAGDTAASSQAINNTGTQGLNGQSTILGGTLTFTFSYLGTAEESLELKHVCWQWKILIRSQQTSSPDLHRGTPCWYVVAPRYCRRLVWGTLSSGGGRGTSRGSWFGPQDINWSDRLPYLLLTITYRHWNFFFATNSLPPQWGTKQIAMALFLPNNTIVEFYSYQCHSL